MTATPRDPRPLDEVLAADERSDATARAADVAARLGDGLPPTEDRP